MNYPTIGDVMTSNSKGVTTECPVHGSYRSWLVDWGVIQAQPMMSGCPKCVLEHHQAKNGYRQPSLPDVHRPAMIESQISESVPAVSGQAGEQR